MKHDREVIEAFDGAFQPGNKEVTQEDVDQACRTVLKEAAEFFDPEEPHVFGILNPDMGGVSFRFKRPGTGHRIEYFVKCRVERPVKVAELTQEVEVEDESQSSIEEEESEDPGLD